VSAGCGEQQFFSKAEVDSVEILEALVDTGSSFSMISAELYERLSSRPALLAFSSVAPDIVGVGGASAAVKGYIDIPFAIAETVVKHPLLVVEGLSFSLLVGMDVLRPHDASFRVGKSRKLELSGRPCNVCREPRVQSTHSSPTAVNVACTAERVTILPKSAAIVRVVLPESARDAHTVALDTLDARVSRHCAHHQRGADSRSESCARRISKKFGRATRGARGDVRLPRVREYRRNAAGARRAAVSDAAFSKSHAASTSSLLRCIVAANTH